MQHCWCPPAGGLQTHSGAREWLYKCFQYQGTSWSTFMWDLAKCHQSQGASVVFSSLCRQEHLCGTPQGRILGRAKGAVEEKCLLGSPGRCKSQAGDSLRGRARAETHQCELVWAERREELPRISWSLLHPSDSYLYPKFSVAFFRSLVDHREGKFSRKAAIFIIFQSYFTHPELHFFKKHIFILWCLIAIIWK